MSPDTQSCPCCILSKFYIKPQLPAMAGDLLKVVSYRNSTSNHNAVFYITFLVAVVSYRNSTSNHNALPSSYVASLLYLIEILHQTTTASQILILSWLLYLIEILHQTTTMDRGKGQVRGCILSKFYIKPQHGGRRRVASQRCILSKFYIKPQLSFSSSSFFLVVSYRNSTSNHNVEQSTCSEFVVVSYRNSTSNHNP